MQTPAWQVSVWVQALPSLQPLPFVALVAVQVGVPFCVYVVQAVSAGQTTTTAAADTLMVPEP